jgi:pimeloyl-ACP methyl ester carboxylesterase
MLAAMRALRLLAALLAAAALLLLALPYAAPLYVFRPQRLDSADPRRWQVPAEEVSFAAADGSRLSGWWVAPPSARAPVVLLVHGHSGNIATRAEIVRRLAGDGFGVLAFDYRGYGASAGSPSEAGLGEDAAAAYQWLRAHGVPAGRIIVVGQSLGNAPAAALAASHRVGQLVLVSPFVSLPETAAARLPWLPLRLVPWPRNRFEVAGPLRRVAAPVLLIVARRDEYVPYEQARALARSLPRQPLWIEDESHGHEGLLRQVLADGRLQPFLRAAAED